MNLNDFLRKIFKQKNFVGFLLVIFILFYFFNYLPNKKEVEYKEVKVFCHKNAIRQASGDYQKNTTNHENRYNITTYESYYKICLRSKGLN